MESERVKYAHLCLAGWARLAHSPSARSPAADLSTQHKKIYAEQCSYAGRKEMENSFFGFLLFTQTSCRTAGYCSVRFKQYNKNIKSLINVDKSTEQNNV